MAGNFEVRLSLRDADTVKRGLQSLGNDGERALKRLEQATQPASKGLQLLNEASGFAQGSLQELASRGGAAGEALASLGKGGLAAAAGLGAAALAVAGLIRAATAATQHFGDIADAAQRAGTSAESFQTLSHVAEANASSAEELGKALETLRLKIDEAAGGSATAQAAFTRAGVSMEFLQKHGGDTAAVLNEMSKHGISAADAVDLLGRGGKGLLPTLQELNGHLSETKAELLDTGKIASDQVVKAFDDLADNSVARLNEAFAKWSGLLLDVASGLDRTSRAGHDLLDIAASLLTALKGIEESASRAGERMAYALTQRQAWESPEGMRAALRQGLGITPDIRTATGDAGGGATTSGGGLGGLAASARSRLSQLGVALDKPIQAPAASGTGRRSGGGGQSEAVRDAERDAKAIADLRQEIELFGRTRDEAIDKAASRLSDHASADQVAEVKALAGQLYDLAEAQKAAQEAEREHQRLLAEGKALYEATRTPAEEYADTLERLNALQKAGAIDQTTYNRALDDAREKADAGDREMAEAHQEWLDQQQHGLDLMVMANDAATMFGSAMTTAFEDAIVGGAKFQDVLTALTTDLQKFVLRMAIAGLLRAGADAIGGAFSGGSSFSTAGGTNNGWATGGFQTTPIVSARGNVFDRGDLVPFARGGLVDQPTIFPMARGAGLMGEAGPEAIAPLRRTATGDLGVQAVAPVVSVTVNNNSNAQVSTDTRKDENGNLEVIFDVVEQRMASQLARPGTRLNRAASAARSPVVSR